jgi:Cd2+/Zn2+-exporting ATPase
VNQPPADSVEPVTSVPTPEPEASACPACPAEGQPTGAPRAFDVEGLNCADEVAALSAAVGPLVGGADHLAFDLIAGRMIVDGSRASDAEIAAAVSRAGLRARPVGGTQEEPQRWWANHGRLAATVASAVALLAGLLVHALAAGSSLAALGLAHAGGPRPAGSTVLYLLATVAGGVFVLPRAVAAARALRPDMNLLMTIAVLGAIAIGELLEAASVAFLFALALLLESWSVARARHAVRALLDLAPPVARVLAEGREESMPLDRVAVGATVVVRPGERIPLDGKVAAGHAHVDTAPVTGEFVPKAVGPGDDVYAGTISIDGALEVRVSRPAADTVIARIVRRVAEAGRHRSRAERWVDRFARLYTPAVFAAALLTAVLPPLLAGASSSDWLYRSLVLLVIGCPCALVISTPVSIVAGLASAARHGVLVKGGDLLEVPAGLAAIAFDKTGTLTTGRPVVAAVTPVGEADERHVLAVAAALESRSSHPIAAAVVAAASRAGIERAPAEGVRALPGRGIEGLVGSRRAWLGSQRLLEERGEATPELLRLAEAAERIGRTVVVVGEDGHICGLIALEDEPRPSAAAAVAELWRLGIERTALVTGDNPETAAAVARAVGITDVHAGLLPEEKIAVVERLRAAAGGRRPAAVAFVGDGINDAPALAAADLGIAAGAGATDAAIETADVALVSGDLGRIPWLVRHSRRTLAVIRANVAFALAIKALFVALALAGHASLWAAIAADMGASLLVIANALRLLRS